MEGNYQYKIDKCIIIVAPHTSWWDFPLGLIVRGAMGKDIKYLGKHTLFKPPLGWIFKSLGGIPVNRSKSTNMVDQVVDHFNKRDEFQVVLAPEGTRKKVDKFKTGYYFIAKAAKVPIIMIQFDFENKIIRIRDPFWPTENFESDKKIIWNYFKGVKGKNPALGVS